MPVMQKVPWIRIGAESIAIVASILLAFTIDAWWQQRGEHEQAATLVVNLTDDFTTNQQELERVLSEHSLNFQAATAFLEATSETELGGDITIPMAQVIGVVMGPTFSPTTAALDIVFSSGKIDLIEE